jgi:hypothetical protein
LKRIQPRRAKGAQYGKKKTTTAHLKSGKFQKPGRGNEQEKGRKFSDVSQVREDKCHVFSHMWKTDPKDRCVHEYKHDHVHIYIEKCLQ